MEVQPEQDKPISDFQGFWLYQNPDPETAFTLIADPRFMEPAA